MRHHIVARHEMRRREVEQHEVGIHAELQHAALCLAALRTRAADRRHHQHGLDRQRLRVAGGHLCHEGRGLHLLEQVEVVVRCGRVRAESDVHARLDHLRHGGAAGGELQVRNGAVHGRHAALGQQAHVLRRDPDAVGRNGARVKDMVAVEHLRRREAVFLHARIVFLFCLGQVHL